MEEKKEFYDWIRMKIVDRITEKENEKDRVEKES